VRSIDRLSVLQTVADVLGVSLAELREDITVEEERPVDRPQAIEELRLALSGHPALKALLGREPVGVKDELATMRAASEPVWMLVHEARYAELAPILADLISTLERTVRLGPLDDRDDARRLLTDTYQAAAAMLAKISENDAAWIAADRAAIVAEQLSDPLLVAASLFRMAHVFISLRQLAQAHQVAQEAVHALEPVVTTDGQDSPVQAMSLYGAFHLVLAVVAARENHRAEAQDHLNAAREVAAHLKGDRNDFGTEFGPTNVALHAVSIAVDLGDAGTALDLAQDVEPSQLSPERQARFLVDVARAQAMRRQIGEAFRSLERAEEISPEQTHNLLTATEVVRDLIQLAGPHARPELRAMADRFDVAP
jgi:tetratricopeptide (TPR) repeat protein